MRGYLIFFLFIVIVTSLGYYSLIHIPDGHVGIVTVTIPTAGSVTVAPRMVRSGLHLSWPWVSSVRLYSTRAQMLNADVPSSKGAFRLTAQVRLDPDSALAVHDRLGPSYLRKVISPTVSALVEKEIDLAGETIDSPAAHQRLREALATELSLDGLHLDEAILRRTNADADGESDAEPDSDD